MKWTFFFLILFTMQTISAQQTKGVKVLSVDSLKKYNIGIAKDSSRIYIDKRGEIYSDSMPIWEKVKYFAKLIYDRYTILSWLLMILVGLWVLSLLGKLISKF